MVRKVMPTTLEHLYEERMDLKVRINLLEESGENPAELAESRAQLLIIDSRIRITERSRSQFKD